MARVRPEVGDRGDLFEEIDVARITLIRDLTGTMRGGEDALPIILAHLGAGRDRLTTYAKPREPR